MINFAWLWALIFLPLPLLAYWKIPRAKKDDAALHIPFLYAFQGMPRGDAQQGKQTWLNLNLLLAVLCWLLLIAAACRPQWVGEAVSLPTSGRDLMLAVDISGSMEYADMRIGNQPVTRLSAVKAVVGDFTERRQGDRLGLILFGTQAYLQAPLTFDRNTIKTLLYEAQLRMAGEKTAMGDAIGLAIKRLKDREASQRVLILLTDGANTAGQISPEQAAELASQEGVTIYTIGIGSDPSMNRSQFGGSLLQLMRNPSSDLDEASLTKIAEVTGGRYFRAHDVNELKYIYTLLDQLEPVEQNEEFFRPVKSLYIYPLGLACLLILIAITAQTSRNWLAKRHV